ncbi:MAG TPA: hypothetical protein VMZ50_09445 [Phycisphaerae bacterium]|nr:hypothetical protein [Phycisphaerae bacterium]
MAEKTAIAVYGPMQSQFDRVVKALPKAYASAFRFRLVDRSRRKGLPQADMFIIWTKFADRVFDDMLKNNVGRAAIRRTNKWSPTALKEILGPPPKVEKKVAAKKSALAVVGSVRPAPPEPPRRQTPAVTEQTPYRFVAGRLAYVLCTGCEDWRPRDIFLEEEGAEHGIGRVCRTCLPAPQPDLIEELVADVEPAAEAAVENRAKVAKAVKASRVKRAKAPAPELSPEAKRNQALVRAGTRYYAGKKICVECWQRKAPGPKSFSEDDRELDGLAGRCKPCQRERAKRAEALWDARNEARKAAARAVAEAEAKAKAEAKAEAERAEAERKRAEAEELRKKLLAENPVVAAMERRITELEGQMAEMAELLTSPVEGGGVADGARLSKAAALIKRVRDQLPGVFYEEAKSHLGEALGMLVGDDAAGRRA